MPLYFMEKSRGNEFINYEYGTIGKVLARDGRGISNIKSIEVMETILTPKEGEELIIGVFQSHDIRINGGADFKKNLAERTEQLCVGFTEEEDSYPIKLISVIYDCLRIDEKHIKEMVYEHGNDALSRITFFPHTSTPDYAQRKFALESSLERYDSEKLAMCTIEDSFLPGMRREYEELEELRKIYGLTRTEALWQFVLKRAIECKEARPIRGKSKLADNIESFLSFLKGEDADKREDAKSGQKV